MGVALRSSLDLILTSMGSIDPEDDLRDASESAPNQANNHRTVRRPWDRVIARVTLTM